MLAVVGVASHCTDTWNRMRVEQEWKEGMEPSHELNEVFNRMEQNRME